MQFRAKQIAPPKEWGIFEDLCHALFKCIWKDRLAQKHGRRGQTQHGVDIYGSPNGNSATFHGVQCKGKNSNYGSKVKWPEVQEEILKAEKFSPKLEQWILATTAPPDAALQQKARELSEIRSAKGLFSVIVLGWEEIQALMADAPDVIMEFYPEHADHLQQVLDELRGLVPLAKQLEDLVKKVETIPFAHPNHHVSAVWQAITFESERGLGPALMGYPLGPSDAVGCPRLSEVDTVLKQLKLAFSARLIGEPGSGKSICAYQTGKDLAAEGYEVFRLLDSQIQNITLEGTSPGSHRIFIIDDAHLLKSHTLLQIEEQAGPDSLVLSTHNAVEHLRHRGSITLDAKRAVKTIAASLRSNLPKLLSDVRLADDHVGKRMTDSDIGERLDHAENTAERPWQFCFVLGGGWRRSKQSADSARAANNDLILAAVAIRQMVSRDARAVGAEIGEVCQFADISNEVVVRGLSWLENQRLLISASDCRTPHQRFAAVVLHRILEGQDSDGRKKIALMIEGVMCDARFSYAGIRVLLHELRFGSDGYSWKRLLGQPKVEAAIARCWVAEGSDRGFAALALLELWDFTEGGATTVVGPHTTILANWISNPSDGAYGFGRLLNDLAQQDRQAAERAVALADSVAIACAYSNADPHTAYGLADLVSSICYIRVDEITAKIRAALDVGKLLKLACHQDFVNNAYDFAHFCASVVWLDENLALEMADLFVPTAQKHLAKNPLEGFSQLAHDFASIVLHVYDPLNVYVGKLRPSRRQLNIARRMCEKVDPTQVAQHIAEMRLRQFQAASDFLGFLLKSASRKFDKVVRQINWDKLDSAIGEDWENMQHETEVLLGTLSSHQPTRHLVQSFISKRADSIVHFPPRLMLIVPEVGLAHIAKGKSLRIVRYDHVCWVFGGIALAIVADARPELFKQSVSPFIDLIARKVTKYNHDHTGPAECLIRVVIDQEPTAWREALAKIDPAVAEKNLTECLIGDEDHRRTAASVVESAICLSGPVGDIARHLRTRFPVASAAPTDAPRLFNKRRRRNRKHK